MHPSHSLMSSGMYFITTKSLSRNNWHWLRIVVLDCCTNKRHSHDKTTQVPIKSLSCSHSSIAHNCITSSIRCSIASALHQLPLNIQRHRQSKRYTQNKREHTHTHTKHILIMANTHLCGKNKNLFHISLIHGTSGRANHLLQIPIYLMKTMRIMCV